MKKFKIPNQQKWDHHRHGWSYANDALQKLHNQDGVLLETTIDSKLTYDKANYIDQFPINEPWVGFSHLTPNKPEDNKHTKFYNLHDWINEPLTQESLKNCKGIFVLSEYAKNNLKIQAPVSALYHPTDLDVPKFKIKDYYNTIIHCGHHLRNFSSFVKLNSKDYKKIILLANDHAHSLFKSDILNNCSKQEIKNFNTDSKFLQSVPNDIFDDLLSHHPVFVDFYDSSANNTVIECIARNNPIIVNKHPAVVEYLGEGYPLYFDNLEEASEKINAKNIALAYDYLNSKDKTFLTKEYFLQSIIDSQIYKSL